MYKNGRDYNDDSDNGPIGIAILIAVAMALLIFALLRSWLIHDTVDEGFNMVPRCSYGFEVNYTGNCT